MAIKQKEPRIALWHEADIPEYWRPAACSGIDRRAGAVFVAVSGRLELSGGVDDMLRRLGAVSEHRSVHYWSSSRQRLRPILDDASALSAPDKDARRADFKLDELKNGGVFHLLYDDSEPVGPVVHEIEIVSSDQGRLVIRTRNLTAATFVTFSIADPGALQSYVIIEPLDHGHFSYFALSSSALNWSILPDASFINRAQAVFRYYAGEG